MIQFHGLGISRLEGLAEGALSTPRKQLVLLGYLCSRPQRSAPRDLLASLLWEDRDEARARQSLRQALLELRKALGPGLTVTDQVVKLAPGVVESDVEAFERAVADGRWDHAVERWAGEFLATTEDVGGETFHAWLEAERERLRGLASIAFGGMVSQAGERGDWPSAVATAERWVAMLPDDLRAHPRLVEALALAGRPAEAAARAAQLIARTRSDLGTEPDAELVALVTRLAEVPPTRRTPHPGAAAIFSPDFVGREPQMAELIAAWSRAAAGLPAMLVIEGETGMGKTRLAEEFLRRLAMSPNPPLLLRARGRRSGPPVPYEGARALLSRLHLSPGVGGASPAALAALAELAPGLRDRFPGLMDGAGTRAVPDALADALDAVGEERPLLLLLDDVGALDAESIGLVSRAFGLLRARVLVIATARPGEGGSVGELPGVLRLPLHPLPERDLERMLGSMLALPSPERRRLAARLFAATSGHPLHAIEVVAALAEEGLVAPAADGTWHIPDAEGWPLPADLREAVALRLDRLGAEPRAVLDAAAVLRSGATVPLLGAMTGLPEARLSAALETLVSRRFLRAPLGENFEFPHEFMARVAYERLGPERRAELHARAAAALKVRRVGDPSTESLVRFHRTRAGQRPPARGIRRVLVAGAAVLGVGVLLAAGYRWLSPAKTGRPLVLVAQFENRTGDVALDPVGDMAADWVTQGLAQSGLVPVVDPRSARLAETVVHTNGGGEDRVHALARETGAGTVVWGAYYRAGDTLVVQSRITDAGRGEVIRVLDPIRVPIDQPLRAIEQLGTRTAGAFSLMYNRWGSGWIESTRRPPTFEAYQHFLAGMDLHVQYRYADALTEYRQALAADSTYMQPMLWSALAYWSLGEYQRVDSVLRLAERAPEALGRFDQAMLGNARGELRGDWLAARTAAQDMARIAPGSEAWVIVGQEELKLHRPHHALEAFRLAEPQRGWLRAWEGYWGFMAACLHFLGRYQEALDMAREARQRFPRSVYQVDYEVRELAALGQIDSVRARLEESLALAPGLWPRGMVYLDAAQELAAHGHPDDARQVVAAGLALSDGNSAESTRAALDLRANLLSLAGRWDELEALARPLAMRDTTTPAWAGYLGVSAARRGNRARADSIARTLAERTFPYTFGAADLWRARIAAVLGDRARAMGFLREAIDHGFIFDNRLHVDGDLSGLRGYPPYDQLLQPAD